MTRDVSPPSFLRLAGHPLRWRLLRELAASDRQVRELGALIGQPQSVVSYPLGRLRAELLVSTHRSSADRRDAYYSLDLARCAALLTATGGALHPGLRLTRAASEKRPQRSGRARTRVLFLGTGNSVRSRMTQALAEQLSGGTIEAVSAGSHPKPLHPDAVRAMREHAIDIPGRRSKHLGQFTDQRFDYLISLCDRVHEVCPEFPDQPDVLHWSIPDPARDTDAQTYSASSAPPPTSPPPSTSSSSSSITAHQPRRRTEPMPDDLVSGPGGQQILIEDPSGNPIELLQPAGA